MEPHFSDHARRKAGRPQNNPISNLSLSKALKWALDNKKVKKSSQKDYGVCYKAINQISKKVKAPTEEGGEAYFDFSQFPIKEVRKFHVKLILDEGFRSGWTKHNYNKMLGGIQLLFKELVTIEVFEHNPAHDIPYLILPESDKYKSITNEEFKRKIREDLFLDHFNFYVYLMTLYHSGMRPHEALALQISDVDLDKRKITIVPEEISENSKTKT